MRFLSPTDQKCAESSTYWQFFYFRPPGKFRFTHLGEIVKMLCQELDIYIYYIYEYIYDALDKWYGFSISVQHGIDCTTFHSFFSCKVCDWLAKWIIMLRFMDLRWPRVFFGVPTSVLFWQWNGTGCWNLPCSRQGLVMIRVPFGMGFYWCCRGCMQSF